MQNNLRAVKLCGVAHAVAQIADLIWTRHERSPRDESDLVRPFGFIGMDDNFSPSLSPPPSQPSCSSPQPLIANEHAQVVSAESTRKSHG
jgi:hypothetical protein